MRTGLDLHTACSSSATGLSALLGNAVSHDAVTRFFNQAVQAAFEELHLPKQTHEGSIFFG